MTLEQLLDAARETLTRRSGNEEVVVPFAMVSNQPSQVASFAQAHLVCTDRRVGVLPLIRFRCRTGLTFSDRTTPLGAPPVGDVFDTRPATRFAADRADDVTISLVPPTLTQNHPLGLGWRLELVLHSWGEARLRVPLVDGPAGLAQGVGPGAGAGHTACWLLALGDPALSQVRLH